MMVQKKRIFAWTNALIMENSSVSGPVLRVPACAWLVGCRPPGEALVSRPVSSPASSRVVAWSVAVAEALVSLPAMYSPALTAHCRRLPAPNETFASA